MSNTDPLHNQLREEVLSDPVMRAEYDAFSLQLAIAAKMKAMREKAKLTQEAVAEKMHTKKSVIARLEAAGGRGQHSPSLKTLAKYAHALGYSLDIRLKRQSNE